jgi:diguanylate cyclase (GGDEF)-like protein
MGKPVNLLIVDDEKEDLDLILSVLNQEGYEISTAISGEEALGIIKHGKIDIVLVDILMSGMTGFTVCREIRKSYNTRPIQIILISGLTDDRYLEQAIEAGGDDFILKPVVPIELQRRIKVAVIRFRSQFKLYMEREHLMEAVAENEKLSSEMRSQNKSLKKENEDIKKLNVKLESSYEELKQIAIYDMLSGLYNRKSLFDTIEREIERSTRTNTPLTGIMLDIDFFKPINDTYGHQVGDMVIVELGKLLKKSLRKYDYAGRYGGEEFFMVLTNTSLEKGFIIAERLRRELDEKPTLCNDQKLHVTVSIGIAEFRKGEASKTWIERADLAMYRAKNLGRNRIVME